MLQSKSSMNPFLMNNLGFVFIFHYQSWEGGGGFISATPS